MTDVPNVTPADRKEIIEPAAKILAVARDFKIVNNDGYEVAAGQLMLVKGAMKALAAKKKTVMDPLNATVKAARELFAEPEQRLEQAETIFKNAMVSYREDQERERQAAQRRLDEAARKERERAEAEAAAIRARAEEQRKREDEARRAGDAAEADRLARLAAANEVKAEAKTEVAQAVVAPIVQQEAPKVGGIAMRETWSALVLNLEDLVLGVAHGILLKRGLPVAGFPTNFVEVPITGVEANMKFLNNQAKALKRELRYPGVKAVVDKGIAAGSR